MLSGCLSVSLERMPVADLGGCEGHAPLCQNFFICMQFWGKMVQMVLLAVADPEFPKGGGANPKGGAPTYYLANFSRKLHENEEILGQSGGREGRAPPLRSATG